VKIAQIFLLSLSCAAVSIASFMFTVFVRAPGHGGWVISGYVFAFLEAIMGTAFVAVLCFPFFVIFLRRKDLTKAKVPLFVVSVVPCLVLLLGFPLPALFAIPGVLIVVSGVLRGVLPDVYETPGLCFKCGYNLTGNVSGVCPECGRLIQSQSTIDNRQSTIRP